MLFSSMCEGKLMTREEVESLTKSNFNQTRDNDIFFKNLFVKTSVKGLS